ncbi:MULTISPECIES: hypothetical protein [Moorena]|uniref:hypothetical protein n=1 Tax=Moorena TaxID=1155738 RepID=UPI0002DE5FEE|nr:MULTISPECIES: hypothetical protein [Moorena]NEP64665.1 hypothetical protein [Moorena sp. SIO3A5]NEQ10691.1 hypothetical protein [Moorena sp. SIO4E2]
MKSEVSIKSEVRSQKSEVFIKSEVRSWVGCVRDGLALILSVASIETVRPVTHHQVKQL